MGTPLGNTMSISTPPGTPIAMLAFTTRCDTHCRLAAKYQTLCEKFGGHPNDAKLAQLTGWKKGIDDYKERLENDLKEAMHHAKQKSDTEPSRVLSSSPDFCSASIYLWAKSVKFYDELNDLLEDLQGLSQLEDT